MTPLEWAGVGAAVFASAAVYDWANSNYIKANSEDLPGASSLWAGVVSAVGLVGLLGILKLSTWLAAPEIAGFMTGSYLGPWLRRRRR